MTLSSYADVFGLQPAAAAEPVMQGDLVRAGSNYFPHYEVIALSGDKAWVRNVQTGSDHLVLASGLRRLATQSEFSRMAAE